MTNLHLIARDIFEHALVAVNPCQAVEQAVSFNAGALCVSDKSFDVQGRPVYGLAIGKAAASMALGLTNVLQDALIAGVLSGPAFSSFNSDRWQVFSGGHPLPNQQSLTAAQAAFDLLHRANRERAIIVALVSGGGSAMMEWPAAADISLDELKNANRLLVNCGASINEINVIRRAFSAVKGGGLARHAPDATFITLIVSDTNKGDAASVASGPTIQMDDSNRAVEILERYDLAAKLPESIIRAITARTAQVQTTNDFVYVLLDNETALDAAASRARALGFNVVTAHEISEQSIEVGCEKLIERLRQIGAPACLVSGGEFACPVRGDGVGGRNVETVLRCALLLEEDASFVGGPETLVMSAGTDGVDGNSPAAGATADSTTIQRAKSIGLDARDFLLRSDSFSFFNKLNDTIITGPTGTNVRDLRILLKK